MTVEDVLKYYVTSYRLQKQTNFTASAFYNWKKKGRIPLISQLKLEKLTEGKLKANMADLEFE